MTIRPISELNALKTKLNEEDLFKVSEQIAANAYASRKLTYGELCGQVVSAAADFANAKWNLEDLSVGQINSRLCAIESVMSIEDSDGLSTVSFSTAPISHSDAKHANELPNMLQVVNLSRKYSESISLSSVVNIDPLNENGNGTAYIDSPHQYHWSIDNGQRDSSTVQDKTYVDRKTGGVKINDDGYLTIYGWVAANDNIRAQDAWVGLYGLLNVKGDEEVTKKWVLLQVQPFVVGKFFQASQYIGFNLPVKAGLQLKIMTGFNVNGNPSGLQDGNTLMFADRGFIPNCFVGYVTSNEIDFD